MQSARYLRWFLLGLLLVTAGGAVLLAQPQCTNRDPRDVQYFGARHYWQCTFDSLSAATGCGLVTYRIDQDYTPQGRWTLLGIGLVGAALYLSTAAAAARRAALFPLHLRPLSVGAVLTGFLLLVLVVLIPGGWLIEQQSSEANLAESVWRTVSLACGLGWVGDLPAHGYNHFATAIGAISLLGWWPLLLWPRMRAAGVRLSTLLRSAFGLLALGGLWFGLMYVFDLPRGPEATQDTWTRAQERTGPVATQTLHAIGAGLSDDAPKPQQLPDGAKVTLALGLLIGGLGLGTSGGVGLILTHWAISGLLRALFGRKAVDPARAFRTRVGVSALLGMLLAALVVALGLLCIEWLTAARFQEKPTFADALLDAAAAVGGGALSTGLIGTVTSPNLTSGLHLPINLYQIGMTWVMLAMFIGRVLPLAALQRLGDYEPPAPPPAAASAGP